MTTHPRPITKEVRLSMAQFDTWARDFPEPEPEPMTGTPQDDARIKWIRHMTEPYLFHEEGAPCGPTDHE